MRPASRGLDPALSVLWLIDLQPQFDLWQGAALRWFNLSREMVNLGHRVCFSVNQDHPQSVEPKRDFMERYLSRGWFTGYIETRYRFSPARSRTAHLLGHPRLTNLALTAFQDTALAAVEDALSRERFDVVIISERRLLFLVERLRGRVPVVVDWMDSLVLFEWRNLLTRIEAGAAARIPLALKRLGQAVLQERYYGRLAAANLAVSGIDLGWINAVTRRPERGRLLLNAVEPFAPGAAVQRAPEQLVFTGVMDAPNNYEGAVWFIDRVLPIINQARPRARLVILGRDPHDELLKRAGANVIVAGACDDIRGEMTKSALYVAPLISGGGFRNKVLEALSTGTFVAGTSLAVEFLPLSFQRQLLVGDRPRELADRVIEFLGNPAEFEARLPPLIEVISNEYRWPRRAADLLEILRGATAA